MKPYIYYPLLALITLICNCLLTYSKGEPLSLFECLVIVVSLALAVVLGYIDAKFEDKNK